MKNKIKRGRHEKVEITYQDGAYFVFKKGVSIDFLSSPGNFHLKIFSSPGNFNLTIEEIEENKEGIKKIIKKLGNLFKIVITSASEEVLKSKLFEYYSYYFKLVKYPSFISGRNFIFFSENPINKAANKEFEIFYRNRSIKKRGKIKWQGLMVK